MGIVYEKLMDSHPCYAKKKGLTGRIHLPISPACNIECKFCDRQINAYEERPGVALALIKPGEAIDVIERSLKLNPNITVVGIAGPGDTLASGHALETFRLVKAKFPAMIKCMSTNGLLLEEKADEIIDAGIDSLTVTVNAVDPEIGIKLNNAVFYHGIRHTGASAAGMLTEKQLAGIRKISAAGIAVKVNTVLAPGINDGHIEDIAKSARAAGASVHNIIPLIPRHELSWCRAPSCEEIDGARQKSEKYIDVFRHCRRCRADAIGTPGEEDFGSQIYLKRISDTFSHG